MKKKKIMIAAVIGFMVMGVGYSSWEQTFTLDHTVELINVKVRGESLVRKMVMESADMKLETKENSLFRSLIFKGVNETERYIELNAKLKEGITELNVINDSEIPVYIDRVEVGYNSQNTLNVLEKYNFELIYADLSQPEIKKELSGVDISKKEIEENVTTSYLPHEIEFLEHSQVILKLNRLEDLEFLLTDINAEIKVVTDQIGEVDKKILAANTDITTKQVEISSLEGSIDVLNRDISSLNAEISNLSSQREADIITTIMPESNNTTGVALEPIVQVQEADNSAIDSEIRNIESSISSCESSISNYNKEISELKSAIVKLEKEAVELEKEKVAAELILKEKNDHKNALVEAFNTDELTFKIYIKAFNED